MLAERVKMNELKPDRREGGVVLGDDWVAPQASVEKELRETRARRGLFSLNRSPLTRKIITFNLIALNVLAAGILWLNSSRDTLAVQHINALQAQIELITQMFEPGESSGSLPPAARLDETLASLDLLEGNQVLVFAPDGSELAQIAGDVPPLSSLESEAQDRAPITKFLDQAWSAVFQVISGPDDTPLPEARAQLRDLLAQGGEAQTRIASGQSPDGATLFFALSPIMSGDLTLGHVAMISAAKEIDTAVARERERVLQMFVIATLVSIGLSIVLASTIAHPISDLAEAAEIGRERNRRHKSGGRIRIPDLTSRPDEIGRLSGALRGMVGALYDRIDSNEQFAADVSHEIKNPLASLRSAVGSMRMVTKKEHREKLLEVLDHDVRRLDRLVSDISNASRLDAELVKEEEKEFNLLNMLGNITEFLGEDARKQGVEFITDLPKRPITITGLEARLAQVFVNLVTNAISFCEDGDAIRVWVRRRDNRVLIVVEDTGPGIPDDALQKIFKRFYTSRPQAEFGNNSGLGLAISKQIVEAHGGVVWAENIRPTQADVTSEPLGARFVVGLPV